MTKDKPDLIITGYDYNKLSCNCTYAWKRQDEWLYVGSSTQGFARIYGHTIIGKSDVVQDTDTIIVWMHKDIFQAELNEIELILKHTPKYNKLKKANTLFSHVITKSITRNKNRK